MSYYTELVVDKSPKPIKTPANNIVHNINRLLILIIQIKM